MILPAWLFWDDFRAWEFGAARVVAALVAARGRGVAGLLAAGLAAGLPPLVSGALAAAVVHRGVRGHLVSWRPLAGPPDGLNPPDRGPEAENGVRT